MLKLKDHFRSRSCLTRIRRTVLGWTRMLRTELRLLSVYVVLQLFSYLTERKRNQIINCPSLFYILVNQTSLATTFQTSMSCLFKGPCEYTSVCTHWNVIQHEDLCKAESPEVHQHLI